MKNKNWEVKFTINKQIGNYEIESNTFKVKASDEEQAIEKTKKEAIKYFEKYNEDNFLNSQLLDLSTLKVKEIIKISNEPFVERFWTPILTTGIIGVLGTITGFGFLFGSITTVGANEVALMRNKTTGQVSYTAQHGTFLTNPLNEKLTMTTTQITHQFGDIDPSKNNEGYIPFNDKTGNEFNASVLVKWQANSDYKDAILKLYKTTNDTNLENQQIINTMKSLIATELQEFVAPTNSVAASIESTQIPSKKSEMSQALKTSIGKNEQILKYGIEITDISVQDIMAPDNIKEQIQETSKAATQAQVAQRDTEAKIAQLKVAEAEQKLAAQKALNDLLANKFVAAALLQLGINITTDTTDVIIAALKSLGQGGTPTIIELIQQSEYYTKWNGQLPNVIGGDTDLSMLLPMAGSK